MGVSALKFFFRVYNRFDLVDNPLIDMFSKGGQNMAPLPAEKLSVWDPSKVLNEIGNRPRPTTFFPLVREALILLLLSTGWRVDDVWKLGRSIFFSEKAATFRFVEKRKCKIKGSHTVTQSVKQFVGSPWICPVEAVECFLNYVKRRRVDEKFLFVSSTGCRASKDTLRRWIREELALAGIFASAGSCRSASTSFVLERNVLIDVIMRSAGWSSECTFRKYYQREVVHDDDPINLVVA
jgi:integrase